jgi:hypothetical protein
MQGFMKSRALRVLAVLAACQILSACVVVPAHHYRHRTHVHPYDAHGGPPARDYRDPRYRDHRDYRDYRDRRDWDGRR